MGLPEDSCGLSKKRFRLGLNTRRKVNLKEPSVAEYYSNTMIKNTKKTTATNHPEEGKNPVYQDINSSQQKDPLVAPVASLYNIGNTCYLNCMLQTLRYTPGFVKNLSDLKDRVRFEESRIKARKLKGKDSQKTSVWKLVESLDELFRHMRSKESDYLDLCPTDSVTMSIRPDALLGQIRKFNPLFEENYQHDAQELLRSLLSCLDDAETELDKMESERRQKDSQEKSNRISDTNASNDFNLEIGMKQKRLDNVIDSTGAFVSEAVTGKRLRKKVKSEMKVQNPDNGIQSNLITSLNKKGLPQTDKADTLDLVRADIDNTHKVTKYGDAAIIDNAAKEHKIDNSNQNYVRSLEDLMKNSNSQTRKNKPLVRKIDGEVLDSEIITISSDEDSNGNRPHPFDDSPAASTRKRKLSNENSMDSFIQKTSPKLENDKGNYFLSAKNGNKHMISPGKHLTIHSPFKDAKNSSPKQPQSRRSLFSNDDLPNTAIRNIDFSTNQSNGSISTEQAGFPAYSSTSLSHGTHTAPQNSAILDRDHNAKLLCPHGAQLTLKRCDCLSVSPVKPSVNANLLLERLKYDSPGKRKLDFDSKETEDMKGKALKIDSVTNLDTKEEETSIHHNRVGNPITHQKNHDMECESSRQSERSLKYRGCKIKPLSVRLKKMNWLDVGSQKQSFNVHEIYKKEDFETLQPGYSSYDCKKEAKEDKSYNARCNNLEGKATSSEAKEKLVQGLFGGVMGHRTCCCQCEKTSNRSETFLDVSIPVRILSSNNSNKSSDEENDEEERDTNRNSCVYKLLQSLSIRERLCNDNKYFCDQCFTLVEAEHFCFFQDLPKVLAIHLKRFDAGLGSLAGYVSKISDHVSVPEHLPCLIPSCKDSHCRHRYSLYAVVTHSGSSILHGHYRSYVKVTGSFNTQLSSYMNGNEAKNYQGNLAPTSHTFHQSTLTTHSDDAVTDNNTPSRSLIGNTVEDIGNDSFMYSTQLQSINKRCDIGSDLARMSSKCGLDRDINESEGDMKSWWLECDDESIRVFEEEDFLDRISDGDNCALLGTPYILFYHQDYDCNS